MSLAVFATVFASQVLAVPAPEDDIRGLPLTRFYPFEEIGDVSRGARLGFDRFGRLAVMQNGTYMVLNDATWLDLVDRRTSDANMLNVAQGSDGRWYYGSLGGWGVAEITDDGRMRAHSLVPSDAPKWVTTTNFSEIASTEAGIYIGGWNGIVFVAAKSGTKVFVPVPGVSRIFNLGEKVYASSPNHGIYYIDVTARLAREVPGTDLGGVAVDQTTPLDATDELLSVSDGRMYSFNGIVMTPWPLSLGTGTNNRVLALSRLVDGGVALAVNGRGLYFVSTTGQIQRALTNPEYSRITDLANREPGVLWVSTEYGIEKVLYGSPVTIFGQRLGLPISWPQVVRWNGRLIVASAGRLYEAREPGDGGPTRFEPLPFQPATGVWGIAVSGSQLLIGNPRGVYLAQSDGHFSLVAPKLDVARLVMAAPDLCYAIGMGEIGVLRLSNGQWSECAPRIHGVGYPSIVHAGKESAWIELGPSRAARVALRDGKLTTQLFENFPGQPPQWVNIGRVGDTIVLTSGNQRIFFDESHDQVGDAPEVRRLLDEAPFPVTRIEADDQGTYWGSYERGVFTVTRSGGVDRFDTSTFAIVDDHTPHVQLLPDSDVWFSSGQSLYHVDRRSSANLRHAFSPVLISVTDGRTGAELSRGNDSLSSLQELAYAHDNLGFRFFVGSYAFRRPPVYQFRLNRGTEWRMLDNGSVLNFPDLREGSYELEVRLTDSRGPIGPTVSFGFTVLPPWYRSWYGVAVYLVAAALGIWALVRWIVHRSRVRNAALEQLVQKRTDELKVAMEKLNEETRNAATLAERGRLAGEIHDSLQQGLSGLMLNLDSTLKLSEVTPEVRSRLSVARNMVSYTRQEVQHAVWGMESPLLEGAELEGALRRITSLVSSGTATVVVAVDGTPTPLSSLTRHHLLRIAQEAITNAMRHAEAKTISIRLEYQSDAVMLSVVDDGRGFDPDLVLARGGHHFGLRGLRGRATKIGGTLTIRSSSGHGTSITVTVPSVPPSSDPPHASQRAG